MKVVIAAKRERPPLKLNCSRLAAHHLGRFALTPRELRAFTRREKHFVIFSSVKSPLHRRSAYHRDQVNLGGNTRSHA